MPLPTRYFSNKQEKRVAKAIGGRQTANSGATRYQKGDVTKADWLIECKTCTTQKQSFSIKKEWLTKLREEAIGAGKIHHALAFDFGDSATYYILTEREFKSYLAFLEKEG